MKKVIFIILIAVMAISGGLFAREVFKYRASEKIAEELRKEHETATETAATAVETLPVVETMPVTDIEETEEMEETEPEPHKRGQVMWLSFPSNGKKVLEYPVMSDNEDDYYFLDHSAKENGVDQDGMMTYLPDNAGAIYIRSVDYDDHHGDVVFFGHSMKNGSMLKDVRKFDRSGDMYDADLVAEYTEGRKHIVVETDGEQILLTPFHCYHGVADDEFMVKHEGAALRDFVERKCGMVPACDDVYIFITCSYNDVAAQKKAGNSEYSERTYLFCIRAN